MQMPMLPCTENLLSQKQEILLYRLCYPRKEFGEEVKNSLEAMVKNNIGVE